MHRDISADNILLVRTDSGELQGILIDWDHSLIWDPSLGEVDSWRTVSVFPLFPFMLLMYALPGNMAVHVNRPCSKPQS